MHSMEASLESLYPLKILGGHAKQLLKGHSRREARKLVQSFSVHSESLLVYSELS